MIDFARICHRWLCKITLCCSLIFIHLACDFSKTTPSTPDGPSLIPTTITWGAGGYWGKPLELTIDNLNDQEVVVTATHVTVREYSGRVPAHSMVALQLGPIDGRSHDPRANRVPVLLRAETEDGKVIFCERYFLGELVLMGNYLEIGDVATECDEYEERFRKGFF